MGFKTDTSFLRYLTMGALGVRQTMAQLRSLGFTPIELERYCGSNKLWATKVKRLRMPDLLCAQTGLRVEVRAKSDLKIRMSDAPNNPDRTWDAGLRDDDTIAFISVREADIGFIPANEAIFFSCGDIRASAETSKLGPPKSASEGAERDRTWPSVVPSRDGIVKSVDADRLVVEMRGGEQPSRSQTYALKGKHPYVVPGQEFKGEASFLAGSPAKLANLNAYLGQKYDVLAHLKSNNTVDRYAAAKAIPYRDDLGPNAVATLESVLPGETDERIALEAAASAATLGSNLGQERVESVLWGEGRADLRMEAVLILTELKSRFAHTALARIASDPKFSGNEIRQAAIWGLGKAGLKAYNELLPYIADTDENVAMHAIVGFGNDVSEPVIRSLVDILSKPESRRAVAASEALRFIDNPSVIRILIEAAADGGNWAITTLGRLSPDRVTEALKGTALMPKVAPLLLLSGQNNWLATENRIADLSFLSKQDL